MKKRGTREEVWADEAEKTRGGLKKEDLLLNERTGKIVSRRASERARANMPRMLAANPYIRTACDMIAANDVRKAGAAAKIQKFMRKTQDLRKLRAEEPALFDEARKFVANIRKERTDQLRDLRKQINFTPSQHVNEGVYRIIQGNGGYDAFQNIIWMAAPRNERDVLSLSIAQLNTLGQPFGLQFVGHLLHMRKPDIIRALERSPKLPDIRAIWEAKQNGQLEHEFNFAVNEAKKAGYTDTAEAYFSSPEIKAIRRRINTTHDGVKTDPRYWIDKGIGLGRRK